MKKHSSFIRTFLAFSQAVIDIGLYWLSFSLMITFRLSDRHPGIFGLETAVLFTFTMLVVFYFNSLYDFKNWIIWDELKAILKSAALILLIIVLYLYSKKFEISRFIIITGIFIFVPLCLTARYAFRRIFFALGLLSSNIIILGAGRTGEIFAEKTLEHPFTLCHIIGFLDDDEQKREKLIAGFPVLGRLDEFEKIYGEYRIDEAVVAISTASRSLLTQILDTVEFHVKQVHYIPDTYMLTIFSSSVRDVEGMPVISVSQGLLNPLNRFIKSVIDYAGAVVALIVFSPVMILAALTIKYKYGGAVLSVQERVGWKTKHFNVFVFRTVFGGVTRIGKFLRRTGICGLPQLFNVLRGEMSFVGPKPLIQRDSDFVYDETSARKIYAIKPGITGFWQISRKSSSDKAILREMNLCYIRNWSLWLDIVILMRTVYALIRR